MSPEDLGESRVDFFLYPRCQAEEIVRDPGGSNIKTQELFFDSVALDVFWGIDGTKEVAMQVQASLRQTRRDRDALEGSCLRLLFGPSDSSRLPAESDRICSCASHAMGVRWLSGMFCDSVDRERKAWKE
jgi:hypothetical protein